MENEKKKQRWSEFKLDNNLPIDAYIQFLNILNQRLSFLEDHLTVTTADGEETISALWSKPLEEAQKQTQKGE